VPNPKPLSQAPALKKYQKSVIMNYYFIRGEFMKKTLMAALINSKKADLVRVQETLNKYAKITKTRLGIHDAAVDKKADCAFLVVELVGKTVEQDDFKKSLAKIRGVNVKIMRLIG
jgi:hypothetical protein